jgi:hypothetical protein
MEKSDEIPPKTGNDRIFVRVTPGMKIQIQKLPGELSDRIRKFVDILSLIHRAEIDPDSFCEELFRQLAAQLKPNCTKIRVAIDIQK